MQNRRLLKIVALILGVTCGIGVLVGLVLPRFISFSFSGKQVVWNTSTVIKQVQTLSQLVTVKYVLEKVVVFEDVKWYGESRVLMVAHGVVKAGVDFSKLKPDDVVINGRKITIKLPPPIITDAYLDDKRTQIVERTTGMLRQFDKDLEQSARLTAVGDIHRAARNNGILKDAEERARLQLNTLFLQLGFEQVEIK
jgi:hypothetical protein